MRRENKSLIPIVVFMSLMFSCATHRGIEPSIDAHQRRGILLNKPVFYSVYDGRAQQENIDITSRLKEDLVRIYGDSILWSEYFDKTPDGRVAIRIRIITLGSNFGNRLVSTAAFTNAVSSAQASAVGPWGIAIGAATSQQLVFGGTVTGEGWWNGAVWIDLEVQDNREKIPVNFTIPIVAEHKESNTLGYASGDKAAQASWDKAAAQLIRAIDAILRIVRDQQDTDAMYD